MKINGKSGTHLNVLWFLIPKNIAFYLRIGFSFWCYIKKPQLLIQVNVWLALMRISNVIKGMLMGLSLVWGLRLWTLNTSTRATACRSSVNPKMFDLNSAVRNPSLGAQSWISILILLRVVTCVTNTMHQHSASFPVSKIPRLLERKGDGSVFVAARFNVSSWHQIPMINYQWITQCWYATDGNGMRC